MYECTQMLDVDSELPDAEEGKATDAACWPAKQPTAAAKRKAAAAAAAAAPAKKQAIAGGGTRSALGGAGGGEGAKATAAASLLSGVQVDECAPANLQSGKVHRLCMASTRVC